jgi:hypothetical protein
MYHLNKLAKERGGWISLMELFNPEMYAAISILDFFNNREEIKPTDRWLPFGVFTNGSAQVIVNSNVQYEIINDRCGKIHDLNSSIEVGLYSRPIGLIEEQLDALVDGKRLFMPTLRYRPADGAIWLIDYEDYGHHGKIEKISPLLRLIPDSI